jgi:enoyl-CoA hydratase/carnithine racemase
MVEISHAAPVRVAVIEAAEHVVELRMSGLAGNPIDLTLVQTISRALDALETDEACRVVLLTSADRHFCVGATRKINSEGASAWSTPDLYAAAERLFRFRKPIVAITQGASIGGGLGLAMAADFRYAASSSIFAANFTRLGYHPGFGLTATLPRVVGRQAALDLLTTGRRIDAGEALHIGLCDAVADDADIRDLALDFTSELAGAAPLAVEAVKATLAGDFTTLLRDALARELAEQERLKQTIDFIEGMAAMRERRNPEFTGR